MRLELIRVPHLSKTLINFLMFSDERNYLETNVCKNEINDSENDINLLVDLLIYTDVSVSLSLVVYV